jgi:hypothetical protein
VQSDGILLPSFVAVRDKTVTFHDRQAFADIGTRNSRSENFDINVINSICISNSLLR